MGDFFMYVSTLGAVILVIAYITYRREKANQYKTPDKQKDNDWLYLVLAILVILICMCLWGIAGNDLNKENQRPVEERLSIEEFSYKGHQYIMFSRLDGANVVHDPNCECHLKTDSI